MAERIKKELNRFADYLVIFVSVIILAAIVFDAVRLLMELKVFFHEGDTAEMLSTFLGKALTLVIGLEFVRMLNHHTPDLVTELLIYAIARSMIVKHPSFLNIALGVLAIAALFAIRRFLAIPEDEAENLPERCRNIFRRSPKNETKA